MTAPMTAAEYRKGWGSLANLFILAALEEREALLGERVAHLQRGYWQCSDCGEKWRYTNPAEEASQGEVAAKHGVTCDKNPLKADASVGALVRRIREHALGESAHAQVGSRHQRSVDLSEEGLTRALSHLDSLLPKEPEVAPSGWTYRPRLGGAGVWVQDRGTIDAAFTAKDSADVVPPIDREFVAKLLEASRGK